MKRIRLGKLDRVKKRNLIASGVIVALTLAVCAGLEAYQYIRFGVYQSFEMPEEGICGADTYSWKVDGRHMDASGRGYTVSGWIARNGESILTRDLQLIVKNPDGSAYLVPTLMVERTDVTEQMNARGFEGDYDASGFYTFLNARYVHSQETGLYALYQNNGHMDVVDLQKDFAD